MDAPGGDERHLELKVGAVILVAVALLVTFILILGDWSLASRKTMEVYFQNPGGLLPGAAVKVAGRKVGTITEMSFLGQSGPRHPVTQRPALVRVRIEVQDEVVEALRSDAQFYITTKGVLGDPFLEIDVGYENRKLNRWKPVFGIDPPRLDLFLADAADLVNGLNRLLGRNAENLDQILGGGARIVGAVEGLMDGGVRTDRFERIAENVERLLEETSDFVNSAKEKYVDNPKLERAINNFELLSRNLSTDVDPLLKDVRDTLAMVKRLGDTIGPKEQAALSNALIRLDSIAVKADKLIVKVDGMVERIRRGEGTVGQLTADEEIYDDLKELIRDIKNHPWKLIWED